MLNYIYILIFAVALTINTDLYVLASLAFAGPKTLSALGRYLRASSHAYY